MAATAHLHKKDVIELTDPPELVKESINKLAEWIGNSKHCIIYTGAGISTSAGINDFRGPQGKWTRQANGLKPIVTNHIKLPTLCHMAIKKLVDKDIVKYVVSQNTDGLHVKSGIPIEKISELHGNSQKEICKKCNKAFYRDFRTRESTKVRDHKTSRKCTCGAPLYDSIINFGEDLPADQLDTAMDHSSMCDLAIVLGTSMRVEPACELPMMRKKHGKLIICNLQATPYDSKADLTIHTRTDQLMILLMEKLGISIPDSIFMFSFQVNINPRGSFELTNASVNLKQLLKACWMVTSNDNLVPIATSGNYAAQNQFYKQDKGVRIRFDFNFLYPLERIVQFSKPSVFCFELNLTKLSESSEDALIVNIKDI